MGRQRRSEKVKNRNSGKESAGVEAYHKGRGTNSGRRRRFTFLKWVRKNQHVIFAKIILK